MFSFWYVQEHSPNIFGFASQLTNQAYHVLLSTQGSESQKSILCHPQLTQIYRFCHGAACCILHMFTILWERQIGIILFQLLLPLRFTPPVCSTHTYNILSQTRLSSTHGRKICIRASPLTIELNNNKNLPLSKSKVTNSRILFVALLAHWIHFFILSRLPYFCPSVIFLSTAKGRKLGFWTV